MIRLVLSPHEPPQQSLKSRCVPDWYARSPIAATASSTFAALSALSTLSTMAAVESSLVEPHRAMSPAPIRTDAPLRATSSADASAGGGVTWTGGKHPPAISGSERA